MPCFLTSEFGTFDGRGGGPRSQGESLTSSADSALQSANAATQRAKSNEAMTTSELESIDSTLGTLDQYQAWLFSLYECGRCVSGCLGVGWSARCRYPLFSPVIQLCDKTPQNMKGLGYVSLIFQIAAVLSI